MELIGKLETFLDFATEIDDHRIERKKLYSVCEILFLVLAAVVCGSEGWNDIERFGKAKLSFLRRHLPFKNGTPSDDTLRRFFRFLDPAKFQQFFMDWVRTLEVPADTHVAIDGKVSRHTFDGDGNPLHMDSAFASEYRLVLGQEKVADKSNEITAIPLLLDCIDLEGAVVTIDAMGCQRDIAQKIGEAGADYVLGLKGNQGTLNEDVRLVFEDKDLLKELEVQSFQTIDGDHGRIETRTYRTLICPEILKKQHDWPFLQSLVEVTSERSFKGKPDEKTSIEKRYYITSLACDPQIIGKAIRAHWGIENTLHWILDISFRDDDSRIRKGNAPQNMAIVKHMALNMLQKTKGKRESIKQRRKAAGWDEEVLQSILFGHF